MSQVTLDDIEDYLRERCESQNVHYNMDDVENNISQIHNDHLFEALAGTEVKSAHEELRDEFESREDVQTATELAVEHVNRTFSVEIRKTLPRPVVDSYMLCTAQVLDEGINGVYDNDA